MASLPALAPRHTARVPKKSTCTEVDVRMNKSEIDRVVLDGTCRGLILEYWVKIHQRQESLKCERKHFIQRQPQQK